MRARAVGVGGGVEPTEGTGEAEAAHPPGGVVSGLVLRGKWSMG